METTRLETFADGVFAIAATLLIIDVSADARDGALGAALLHHWPQYAAYAVSFLAIGIMWVNHHGCLALIEKADQRFLFINVALLACIAFVPFPTRLVAEHMRDDGLRAAALMYGFTMTATAICFFAFWFYASIGRRLISSSVDQRVIQGISRSYLPGTPLYGGATLLALWSATAAVIVFAAVALFYVLVTSLFANTASSS